MSNLSTYHLFPIVMTVVILKLCGKHKTRLLKPNQTLGLPYGFLVMKYLKEVVQHTTYFPSASDPVVIGKLGGNCKTRLLKPNGTLGLPYGFYIMFSIWVSMIGYVDIPPQTQMAAMPTQLDNEHYLCWYINRLSLSSIYSLPPMSDPDYLAHLMNQMDPTLRWYS